MGSFAETAAIAAQNPADIAPKKGNNTIEINI